MDTVYKGASTHVCAAIQFDTMRLKIGDYPAPFSTQNKQKLA